MLFRSLGALAAATLLLFLRARLGDERQATWLALLYAFGTPIFFRSAYLNQNAIIAHCVLWAYVLAVGLAPTRVGESTPPWRLWGAGGLLGLAVLCDYSSVPILFVFGAWVAVVAATSQGPKRALHAPGWFVLGAAGPIAVLLAYQWDGKPLPLEHGGPVRLLVPKRYAWKSAKWVRAITFMADDELGYWEVRGYSNTADPWTEDRYSF